MLNLFKVVIHGSNPCKFQQRGQKNNRNIFRHLHDLTKTHHISLVWFTMNAFKKNIYIYREQNNNLIVEIINCLRSEFSPFFFFLGNSGTVALNQSHVDSTIFRFFWNPRNTLNDLIPITFNSKKNEFCKLIQAKDQISQQFIYLFIVSLVNLNLYHKNEKYFEDRRKSVKNDAFRWNIHMIYSLNGDTRLKILHTLYFCI